MKRDHDASLFDTWVVMTPTPAVYSVDGGDDPVRATVRMGFLSFEKPRIRVKAVSRKAAQA